MTEIWRITYWTGDCVDQELFVAHDKTPGGVTDWFVSRFHNAPQSATSRGLA